MTTELVLAVYLHFQTVIIKRNQSFRYKFVLIQVISIRTQALKLLKKCNHFKYSLRLNKKNISGDYSSFFESSARTIYNSIEQIFIKQIVPKRLFIATTVFLIKSTMFILMEPLACQAFHLTCPGGMCHMLKGCVFRLQQALGFRVMRNFARYCALNRYVK